MKTDFEARMNIYFDILSNNEKINSEAELLEALNKDKEVLKGLSTNKSRIQRDFRDWAYNHQDSQKRSIIAVKEWMKKHHVNTKMHCMLRDVQDFSKCDLGLFLKVESYRAAPLGEIIRKAFEGSHCFVISDYDTVLVRFGEKEDYDIFLDLCKQFIPNFTEDEDPESR
ncbi:hypothetical protein ACVS9P_08285 [Caproicibacterium sp. NSD3]